MQDLTYLPDLYISRREKEERSNKSNIRFELTARWRVRKETMKKKEKKKDVRRSRVKELEQAAADSEKLYTDGGVFY